MSVEYVEGLLLHLEIGIRPGVFELRAEHRHQVVVVRTVEAGLREVEVDELEHRLDILGRARAAHCAGIFAHRGLHAGRFAGELLAELRCGELADTRHRIHGGHHLTHVVLLVRKDRQTAFGLGVHAHLVGLERRGLDNDLRAVCQRPDRSAVLFVLLGLLHGRALQLRSFGNERLLHHIVLVGLDLGGHHLVADGEHLLFGGVHDALLLGSGNDDNLIFGLDDLTGIGVDHIDVEHLDDHAVELPFGLGIGHGGVLAVVAQIGADELAVRAVVAVCIGALHLTHEVLLGALEFPLGESVACGLLHLGVDGLHAACELSVLGHGGEHRGVERRDDADHVARAHAGTEEGSVGLHGDLLQAGIFHRAHVGFGNVDDLGSYLVVHLLGQSRALDEDLYARTLHFGVGEDADDGLLVVGHHDDLLLRGIGGRCGDVGHHLLQTGFGGFGIQITDDDDRLVVGTVPLVVETLQGIVLEALQSVEIADQVAVLVAGSLAESLQELHRRAPRGAVARAELLHDDAALGVDLFGLQRDEVRPVVQDEHCGVDDSLARGRHVGDVVDGVVPARSGVEVVSELHADGLQILDELLSGEVLRAVEGHVLEEVGQTLLVVLLLDGAHVVENVEIRLPLGLFVMTDVVGHPVLEFARAHLGVRRYGLHRVDLRRHAAEEAERGDEHHQFFHKHGV